MEDQVKLQHNPKQVEYVPQRKKKDCGIACLAMLTGVLYDTIIDAYPHLKRKRIGLYEDEMLEILEDFGYSCDEIGSLPARSTALVAVDWKENDAGHYIVWDAKRKQFLDPLYGLVDKNEMLKNVSIDYIWKILKE